VKWIRLASLVFGFAGSVILFIAAISTTELLDIISEKPIETSMTHIINPAEREKYKAAKQFELYMNSFGWLLIIVSFGFQVLDWWKSNPKSMKEVEDKRMTKLIREGKDSGRAETSDVLNKLNLDD
jgi:hypothetical protein